MNMRQSDPPIDENEDQQGSTDAAKTDGVKHVAHPWTTLEIIENEYNTFACDCGSLRFHISFAIGRPAGFHYNQRYTCLACDRVYTGNEVAEALEKLPKDV